jgi:hypothetical protein
MNILKKITLRVMPLLMSLVTVNAFAQHGDEIAQLPLPKLGVEPLELRVAHMINPRLPRMSDAQISLMLETMAQATNEHFGINVRFAKTVEVPIALAFESIPPKFMALAKRDQYNFRSLFARSSSLANAFGKGFARQGEPLEEMALFADRQGIHLNATNFEAFGEDVAKLQLSRIAQWTNIKALDGKSVIDDQPFHQFTAWNVLGYGDLPFELIITNQVIASVEYIQPSIHTAIRGGYTNGITSFNRAARWGTHSIWSTFAFTQNDSDWIARREGEAYTPQEAARLAGLAATHELGHQLLHVIHPFGQKGCIMDPVPMFSYRAWADKLSPKDCPVGSSKAMTPGSYRFRYIKP